MLFPQNSRQQASASIGSTQTWDCVSNQLQDWPYSAEINVNNQPAARNEQVEAPSMLEDETATLDDEAWIEHHLWKVGEVCVVKRNSEGCWCLEVRLRSSQVATEWFERTSKAGKALREYASSHFALNKRETFVKWRRQLVHCDAVSNELIEAALGRVRSRFWQTAHQAEDSFTCEELSSLLR